jgi:hypothetical protein
LPKKNRQRTSGSHDGIRRPPLEDKAQATSSRVRVAPILGGPEVDESSFVTLFPAVKQMFMSRLLLASLTSLVSSRHRGGMVQPQTSVSISGSAASTRFEKWLEIAATLLLAFATVGSAWSAYQAKRWGGVQMFRLIASNGARSEAIRLSDKASQLTSIDVSMFLQYASAVSSHQQQLADFILQRFRPEMKVAMDAWQATRPLKNPDSPLSPFAMKEYSLSTQTQADQMNQVAQKLNEAKAANTRADDYVLLTVLFASALFFGGIGTKMQLRSLRIVLLSLGIVVFLATAVTQVSMPIARGLN